MNTIQTNYIKAKALTAHTFEAMTGEGTDAEWDAFEDAQRLEKEAAEQLIEWARGVALKMAGAADRADLEALFDNTRYEVRAKVLGLALKVSA